MARHDAAARDGYPHALWGAWAQPEPSRPSIGNGVDKPFEISSAAELVWFRDQVNSGNRGISAKLTVDIDLAEFCHAADGIKYTEELSWTPIGNSDNRYQGTFDGNGKTIKNLYINATTDDIGFFGGANKGGCIKNITFYNAKVKSTGDYRTGVLAGDAGFCIIENIKTLANCSVEGKDHVGGIAGNAWGNIINCENHAMVNGTENVGGILGFYSSNSITSCANYGEVTSTGNSTGGMVGYFASGTIQNSANYGNITGTNNVGNLIGFADICNLSNVLGTGNVKATSANRAGLLVGTSSNPPAPLLASWHTTAVLSLPSIKLSRQVMLSRLSEKAH